MIEDLLESRPDRLDGDTVSFGDVPIKFKLSSYGESQICFADCNGCNQPHHTFICLCTEKLSDSLRIAQWVMDSEDTLYEYLHTDEITIEDAGSYTQTLIKEKVKKLKYDIKDTERRLNGLKETLSGIK